jgi:hypothetical protein
MPIQKEVYPLTVIQAEELKQQNTDLVIFAPIWSDELNSVYIDSDTLDDLNFINHKNVFDSFDPQPVLTEITILIYTDFF